MPNLPVPDPFQWCTPEQFNRRPTASDTRRLKETVVRWLIPILAREIEHIVQNEATTKRHTDSELRIVCDFCATTIFGGSWACTHCAKEYCFDCKHSIENIRDLEFDNESAIRLLDCTSPIRGGAKRSHGGKCLAPVSRYTLEDLFKEWHSLISFVRQYGCSLDTVFSAVGMPFRAHLKDISLDAPTPVREVIDVDSGTRFLASSDRKTHTSVQQPSDPALVESHPFFFLSPEQTLSTFDDRWQYGIPIVVEGVKLKLDWSPEAFIERAKRDPQDAECCECLSKLLILGYSS